jgi:hypothetical protein
MIEIYAVTYNGQPAAASVRGAFGPEGGTLGRSPDNRLPLPDPAVEIDSAQPESVSKPPDAEAPAEGQEHRH